MTSQRSLDELRQMTAEELREAHATGALDSLLFEGKDPAQLSAESLRNMSAEAINQARREGRLDQVLGRR